MERMDKRVIRIKNIIADSIHLLYEKGYNGVGIQEIVESANIPKGSFTRTLRTRKIIYSNPWIFFIQKWRNRFYYR